MANRPPERSGASYLLGVGGAGGAGGGWGLNSPADPRKETKFPRRSPYGRGEMAAPLQGAAPQIPTHEKAGPTSARGRARMIPADNKKNCVRPPPPVRPPKKFICKNTRSAAQFMRVFNLFVTRAGAMPLRLQIDGSRRLDAARRAAVRA